ncbi:hypothetical protein PoB_004139800 [Plakobranchus ocellatus]|uniref:Uncharacterized protein n=1 Tax=Plakobranchus ocellatus TaxID=259542 RepID=A0AAV4B7V0_9GAST|nr:hypothetical protein PoB_004139800 [Plakobranchus ocellatus]
MKYSEKSTCETGTGILRVNSRIKKEDTRAVWACCASRAGGSRPSSEVSAGAWSLASPHGSSEEHTHNLCCRTHGYSITAPEDFVHRHGGPSPGTAINHFPAFGQDMRNPFFPFPTKNQIYSLIKLLTLLKMSNFLHRMNVSESNRRYLGLLKEKTNTSFINLEKRN